MEKVREAIEHLAPQEAYLISDREVELLLEDGRTIRVTAMESLKSGGFSASHEQALSMELGEETVTVWASVDFPWAAGDTAEECLASAILLMHLP